MVAYSIFTRIFWKSCFNSSRGIPSNIYLGCHQKLLLRFSQEIFPKFLRLLIVVIPSEIPLKNVQERHPDVSLRISRKVPPPIPPRTASLIDLRIYSDIFRLFTVDASGASFLFSLEIPPEFFIWIVARISQKKYFVFFWKFLKRYLREYRQIFHMLCKKSI